MFQDATLILGQMGLKHKDAKVYLACLHFPEGLFVHELVKQTRLKRSTIDVVLKRLIELGYLNKIKIGARYKYMAQKPEAILFKQERLVEDFRDILPILNKLGSSKDETEIRFFEGREGLRKIYDDILLQLKFSEGKKRELVSFSSGIDTLQVFPDMQKQFIDKRIKMKIWYKAIVPSNSLNRHEYVTDEKAFRLIKSVEKKKFPFKVTFETYADSVMIYSPRKPYGGVVINNTQIAESMRSLFYLMWELLPD